MKLPFRVHHLCQLLEIYDQHPGKPIDYSIACYFRAHKALGSKDRVWIGDTVYALLRWKVLYDFLLQESTVISWLDRFELYTEKPPHLFINDENMPVYVRAGFPKELFDILEGTFHEKTFSLCLDLNERAPITIRANALKTTREALLDRLKLNYDVSPCSKAPFGISFQSKVNFFSMPEFKEGLFEVQDEASQLVAAYIPIHSNDRVLDYCAGAGGKTLAFADKLENRGQIYLHDVRLHALYEAKKRLKRAGIQNGQIIHSDEDRKLRLIKNSCDVVLVDAPCSGTGTLRRNPDMKFRFSQTMLQELVAKQYAIFSQALAFVKPGGAIVYATCSILKEENEEQVEKFIKNFPITVAQEPLKIVPEKGGMDGFFAVCFRTSK